MENSFEIIVAVISTGITCFVGYIFNKFKEMQKESAAHEEALRIGLLALCRDRILQGYRYYKRNGGISSQDLETMQKLYSAYHTLGGNGTITAVWSKIKHLPLKDGEI